MKIIISFVLLTCFYFKSYSQNVKPDTSNTCSNKIRLLSYFWKLDSLANNGFRLYTYKTFLNCRVNKVTKDYLLEKLGNPSRILKSTQGVEYMYYFYDSKKMPKEFGPAFECGYVAFIFDLYEINLMSVQEGVLDY